MQLDGGTHQTHTLGSKVCKLCSHRVQEELEVNSHTLEFEDPHPAPRPLAQFCCILFLSRNNTSIHYRLERRQRVTEGAARGALCAFCLLPIVTGAHLTNMLLHSRVTILPLMLAALSGALSSCIGPERIWCLMEKGKTIPLWSDLLTGDTLATVCAALVIELMSKWFIAHPSDPFLEAHKDNLYGCGHSSGGSDGVRAGERWRGCEQS